MKDITIWLRDDKGRGGGRRCEAGRSRPISGPSQGLLVDDLPVDHGWGSQQTGRRVRRPRGTVVSRSMRTAQVLHPQE
jgi:hypothetical protein